jgi:nucleoside-diphosphate-sugar epimerase
MPTAFILGASGQIGLALADELLRDGWAVIGAHRGTIAYTHDDALQLTAVRGVVGRYVVVSSASVYCDEDRRTLDEAATTGFPHFPVPITEEQPTTPSGPATYSTRKVAIENELLANVPTIVLRPCAIHGIGSTHPREWWFVKRALDGRTRVPLAFNGESRFQTTSTRTIARFVSFALHENGVGIFNLSDRDAPSVMEIGRAIGSSMRHSWTLVPVPGESVGSTPWSVPRPMIVAARNAAALGFAGATAYGEGLPELCAELVARARDRDWRDVFPALAAYPEDLFDYAAEDRVLVAGA